MRIEALVLGFAMIEAYLGEVYLAASLPLACSQILLACLTKVALSICSAPALSPPPPQPAASRPTAADPATNTAMSLRNVPPLVRLSRAKTIA